MQSTSGETLGWKKHKLESRLPGEISITSDTQNPLQCSCLENPRDRGAWWAAVYGVTQSWTRLKRLSSSSSRYTDDTTLMAESKKLKSLLIKVKEESKKAGLKLNIQKMKIMASSPITSWQINGETMKTVRNFLFLGSKIIADGNCMKLKDACSLEEMLWPI